MIPFDALKTTQLGSLKSLRVLDLSRVLAGPLATQIMADHGATVIKVEPPAGDETRQLGPPFAPNGSAAYFESINRGKHALSLDLTTQDGQEIIHRILQSADILIENFLPGAMKRWQLDYETHLSKRYPRLIHCSISGFGTDGPMGGLPGYDAVLQAQCGLMSVNGDPSSGNTRIGLPVVDYLTGYNALVGILMAVHERHQTGKGQKVETTLFDTALSWLVPHAANWFRSGLTPQLMGSAHPNIALYDKFKCQDGEIFLAILNEGQFQRFCKALDLEDIAQDPRFASNELRVLHRQDLRPLIESSLNRHAKQQLCAQLMQNGVPCGPVNSVPEALEQPHAQARGTVISQDDYRGIASPIKLSRSIAEPVCAPPAFAQDSDHILTELGYTKNEIDAFKASGVVITPKPHSQ